MSKKDSALGLLNSLTAAEKRFFEETKNKALRLLDEDQALDLQARTKRLRDKARTVYRRAAADAVTEQGGRGVAYEENSRNRDKLEVFEQALARVSKRTAILAKESAKALKKERLALAKKDKGEKKPGPSVVKETEEKPVNASTAFTITGKGATRRAATERSAA